MITLDFYAAIAAYVILVLCVVLLSWIFTRKDKDKLRPLDARFIWHCSVCTYTYINTKDETITTCPRCGSFNKK
jgi:hypothetical protein